MTPPSPITITVGECPKCKGKAPTLKAGALSVCAKYRTIRKETQNA